jgi:multisubunit Na+/H+ antiporter MnhG subunit
MGTTLMIVAYASLLTLPFFEWLMQLPFKDFATFLAWVTGPDAGGFVIISWAMAWGLDRFDFWNKLESKTKSLLIFLVSALFGCIAIVLSQYPAIVVAIDPYFKVILSCVVMWLTTQVSHKNDPIKKTKPKTVYNAESK